MVLKFRKDLMQMKIKEKNNTNHQQNKCVFLPSTYYILIIEE